MTGLFSNVYQQFWIKIGSKTLAVSAKVAEILVETCFCQDGLNRWFKRRFKPLLAETCQHWFYSLT